MITVKQFLKQNGDEDFRLSKSGLYVSDMMIGFAKLHVKQALEEVSNKARIKYSYSGNTGSEYCDEFVDPESILNAYNIEKI